MGLLAVAAVIIFIAEPLPVDPMIYLRAGVDPLSAELNHWTTRIGIVIPIWIISLMFGYSEITYYAFPIAVGFIFGAAVSALGRTVSDSPLGSLAAPVALAGPIVLPFASLLLPDVGAAAFLALTAALLIRGSNVSGDQQFWSLFAAGIAFGISYLIRETILVFAPALLIGAWILRLNVRQLLLVVGGALVAPGLEAVVGVIFWSDPLARINGVILRAEDPLSPAAVADNRLAAAAQGGFLKSLAIFLEHLWANWYGRLLAVGGALFAGVAVWRRSRQWLFITSWIMLPWMVFASLGAYRPEPERVIIRLTLDRYWAEFIPPIAVGLVALLILGIQQLSSPRMRRFAIAGLSSILVLLVAFGVHASFQRRGDWFMRFGNDDYWQLRAAMSEIEDDADLLVPDRLRSLVELYTRDPLGTRLTTATIISHEREVSKPPWVLFHGDVGGPEPEGVASLVVSPPDDYRVFAAEGSKPRWVILTPDQDFGGGSSIIAEIDSNGRFHWLARKVIGESWGEVFPLPEGPVDVGNGEQLVVFDDSSFFGAPPGDWELLDPGVLVETRVHIDLNKGRISQACYFFPADGAERIGMGATLMITAGPTDGEVVGYCRPPEVGGPFWVRPVIVFTGPSSVSIESGRVVAHPAG